MTDGKCINIKRIERMEAEIFGDSQPGLKVSVAQLVITVSSLTEVVKNNNEAQENNSKVQRAILRFMDGEKGKGKAEQENKVHKKWVIGTSIAFVGLIISFAAIVIAVLKYGS